MLVSLLVFAGVVGFPVSGFAKLLDKGDYVQVKKGTTLCSSKEIKQAKGPYDAGKVFWRVTSNARPNGTQLVSAIEYETVYDRKSGDTTIRERRYDDDYATLFTRDPEHKGMLLMISPENGTVQAIVEVCRKGNKQGAGSLSTK